MQHSEEEAAGAHEWNGTRLDGCVGRYRSKRTRASFFHPANLRVSKEHIGDDTPTDTLKTGGGTPTDTLKKWPMGAKRRRTVAARTQAESDRVTVCCGGELNGCEQGRTENNSQMASRAGFEKSYQVIVLYYVFII
jgi:hypothetical protein